VSQQDDRQARTDVETPPPAAPPAPAPRRGRAAWIGWLIVILAFLAVNGFLQIYCYWIFLPYPRW